MVVTESPSHRKGWSATGLQEPPELGFEHFPSLAWFSLALGCCGRNDQHGSAFYSSSCQKELDLTFPLMQAPQYPRKGSSHPELTWELSHLPIWALLWDRAEKSWLCLGLILADERMIIRVMSASWLLVQIGCPEEALNLSLSSVVMSLGPLNFQPGGHLQFTQRICK